MREEMEAQTKVDGDEVKETVTEVMSRVLVTEPPLESNVEPLVEASTQNAESQVLQEEKGSENLASLIKGTSDENAGTVESMCAEEVKADVDEKSRTTHVQPFVVVSAETRASWMNCCGLLDVLRHSDQ